jgi:hypothetical protein
MLSDGAVAIAGREYEWSNDLLVWPPTRGWAHHDVATLSDGRIITSHPDGGLLLEHRPDGSLVRTIPVPLTETHGMHVSNEGGIDALWIADNGHKALAWDGRATAVSRAGRVVRLDLQGTIDMEISCPDLPAYADEGWQPCAVAIVPGSGASDRDLWVADGYGASLIHCFAADGSYRGTIDAAMSGTTLDTPHALLVVGSGPDASVYVADRGNSRILVFDPSGSVRRIVRDPRLRQPSGLALSGDRLFVTDLAGGVAVFGPDDSLLEYVGAGAPPEDDAWPNVRDADGRLAPPPTLREHRFNSPHGITVDGLGRVLVSEWVLGGRVVCLSPA